LELSYVGVLGGSGGLAAARHNHIHIGLHQLGHEAVETVVSALRPPILNSDVLAFDVAEVT
jgi:hypothetical protein